MMTEDVGIIADAVVNKANAPQMRVAEIVTLDADGLHATTSVTGDASIAVGTSDALAVGSRVWMIMQGPTGVIAGRLSADPSPPPTPPLPVGALTPFAGSAAPDGWLICTGQAVSRSTYSALFATIGTTYGAGNGTSTFNVPDMRNRFPVGVGWRTLGSTGGQETVTLSTGNLPPHDHGDAGSHQHASAGAHTHTTPSGAGDTTFDVGAAANPDMTVASSGTATSSSSGAHQHPAAGTHSHASVGSSNPVTIVPPYTTVNYIIKAVP